MSSVAVEGGVFEFAEEGSGRPLLLLHSLLADRGVFDRIVPLLADRRRVIAVDLPGFGGSSPVEDNVDAFADRIAELFPAVGLGPETDVLGNGFGGFIASALAIRHGRSFDRLVLADTGVTFSEAGRGAFQVMARRVREGGMEAVVEMAMKRLFPDEFIATNPGIVAERRAALLKMDPTRFAGACEALAKLDLGGDIGGVRNPTLVVVGSLDAATPPSMARELAASIPGATLSELQGCGHAPMAQEPRAFVAAISAFLARAAAEDRDAKAGGVAGA
jgi:3-oxoadipate enol-lactonase